MPINPLYATYPFFAAARGAVGAADISPAALIAEGAPAKERGRERVERALMEGTVAPEDPARWDPRDELLSYPIARILVSLIDTPAAVEKYAEAEAATAYDRFVEDFESDDDGLKSTAQRRLSLDDVLDEFDLGDAVRAEPVTGRHRDPSWFRVAVGPYLTLSDPDWGEHWRLVNRELADGAVRVEREELYQLLREAVYRRVAEGLPFEVEDRPGGEDIAAALETEVSALRDLLGDRERTGSTDVGVVAPEQFPPCMTALLTRAREGESLDPAAGFALVSFLTGLGMDAEEVFTLVDGGLDADRVETQVTYLEDRDGTQYAPPSCETMDAYGLCVNRDERCETVSHPVAYYEGALLGASDVSDWREQAQPE